jgi:protein-arginine kinase activator protein McsA
MISKYLLKVWALRLKDQSTSILCIRCMINFSEFLHKLCANSFCMFKVLLIQIVDVLGNSFLDAMCGLR